MICSYFAKHVMTFILGCVRISHCVIFCIDYVTLKLCSQMCLLLTAVGYATEDKQITILEFCFCHELCAEQAITLRSCIPGCFIGLVRGKYLVAKHSAHGDSFGYAIDAVDHVDSNAPTTIPADTKSWEAETGMILFVRSTSTHQSVLSNSVAIEYFSYYLILQQFNVCPVQFPPHKPRKHKKKPSHRMF